MKIIWTIIRWLVGLTFCLIALAGFATGDLGLAFFILAIGLLFLPPVTKALFNKKATPTSLPTPNSQSNAGSDKKSSDELVNVTSTKVDGNTTKMTVNLNEEKLVALFKEKQQRREAEIKSFNYVPMQIQNQGLQLLESINILNTTKNLDTLIGRYDFISKMYDDFVKASHNKRYVSDIQTAIDQYKSLYYDKILKDYELALLVRPDHENLTEYYSDCLFNCFNGFYKDQISQIEVLKKDDAKQRRKEKIVEIADKTIIEFDKNGSDNDRFKPALNVLRETIRNLDATESKPHSDSHELINPIVINPKNSFELTLYNAAPKEIKKVIKVLQDDNVWNKQKDLLPLFAEHNIKCKEIEEYISKYKPQYHEFIEKAKSASSEYKEASEMDRLDIENELKEDAVNSLYERAACELDLLFEGSEIPETIDDTLIKEYGFDTISKYIGLSYYKDKIVTHWERKEFEDLLKCDLAISGSDIPNGEILFSQSLKTLNAIAEKEEGHFKRKQKAVDYLNENPELLENIGKHISTRSMFKIKPLPEKFESIDLESISQSWAYMKEYISLLTDTYRSSERCTNDINRDNSWIKEFRVQTHEEFSPDFICQRARTECGKKYSKNRPPKLPFHVGCNCNLRTEV